MKAFLLAAGKGTRLRPITDTRPKCLVEINGTPLLEIWLRQFAAAGVNDVLINTHHLPDQVREYVDTRTDPLPRVTLFHEETLIGSAGTVAANREWIGDDEEFLVVYADNLTDVDLRDLIAFRAEKTERGRPQITQMNRNIESAPPPGPTCHAVAERRRIRVNPCNPWAIIALFHSPTPKQCGIASLDSNRRIVAFEEKPERPESDLANAGIYLMSRKVLDLIPDKPIADFGYDVLPQLIGKMYGYEIIGFFCDTGTLERLEYARQEWKGEVPTDHTDEHG
ncbi:MAG: nucleotidyltransferase family protein [Kiritimatiellia bacterium]|nr:nucleotidyltransferase family protein [Kiritimatiellia bacterium]